jgi:hypothetical protein
VLKETESGHTACKEEFLANYPEQNVLEKSLAAHKHRIVNRFVTTGSVEKGKSSGRPKVIADVVENLRHHLEERPRTSLTRLSFQTGAPRSTCHKIVKREFAFTSTRSNNCTKAPP